MELSRLKTIEIDSNTPLCVILEIALTHGIDYDSEELSDQLYIAQMIDLIYSLKPEIFNWYQEELEKIATFVNPSVQEWTVESLIQCFEILSEQLEKIPEKLPLDQTFGLQTPKNPQAVNLTVLYQYLINKKIKLTRNSSQKEMIELFKLTQQQDELILHQLRTVLFFDKQKDFIRNNRTEIFKLLVNTRSNKEKAKFELTKENLQSCFDQKRKIYPRNEIHAICLAAQLYQKDMSKSENPLLSYLSENLTAFPSLSERFNDLFPLCFYQDIDLKELLKQEGCTSLLRNSMTKSKEGQYQKLCQLHSSLNVYSEQEGELKNKNSPIFQESFDQKTECLFFGLRNKSCSFVPVKELNECWAYYQHFVDPFSVQETLTEGVIKKIIFLAKNKNWSELLATVKGINRFKKEHSDKTRKFFRSFQKLTDKKELVLKTLKKLLETSMFMRGWSGKGKYSLKGKIREQGKIDLDVSKNLLETEKLIKQVELETKINLNNLDLLRYHRGKFKTSTRQDEGLTLGQKIKIVKEGETSENISTCIRSSSNWLAASCYYYFVLLKQPAPFVITELSFIE